MIMNSIIAKYLSELDNVLDNKNGSFIYRGQADSSWEIQSTAFRRFENSNIEITKPHYNEYHRKLIKDAKSYRYHSDKKLTDTELLAELQHYGASTGLIDFSQDFLIALWFATAHNDKDGKVFIINTDSENIKHLELKEQLSLFEKEDTAIDEPCYYLNSNFKTNNRISAQKGVFIFGYKILHQLNIVEVFIKKEDKKFIRESLKQTFAISEEGLFQDIYGFASINNSAHLLNTLEYKQDIDYFAKGNEYIYNEQYNEAIEINPKDDEAYHNMGIAYDDLEKYNESLEAFKKSIEINPNRDATYYNMGIVYGNLEKHNEEIEAYKKVIKINPNKDEAYYNMGIAYGNLEKYNEAVEVYQKSIEINPNKDEAYYNMGIAYVNLEKHYEAIEVYQKAIEINPNNDEAYYNIGIAQNLNLKCNF